MLLLDSKKSAVLKFATRKTTGSGYRKLKVIR